MAVIAAISSASTLALADCFQEDIQIIYLKDMCHVDDIEAVKDALRSKYDLYYECYALFAGRSQWPFVRYVDMFSVFEEARVVERSGRRKVEKRRLQMQACNQLRLLNAVVGKESCGLGFAWHLTKRFILRLGDIHVMITQTLANHNGSDPTANMATGEAEGPKKKPVPSEGNPVTRPQFFEATVLLSLWRRWCPGLCSEPEGARLTVMLRAALSWGEDLSAGEAILNFADEIVAGHLLQPPLAPFPRGIALRPGEYYDALQNCSGTMKEAWERFGYSNVAFQRLAQLVRLCDRSFTSKHVASIYTLAKVPVVDDRASTAGPTRGLSYPEFQEAVGRLAMVWSRSSWMPACCPQEDGSLRGRSWPPQPQVGRPVKERILAKRLDTFVQRLAERMKPTLRHPH